MTRLLRLCFAACVIALLGGCVGLDFSPDGKSVAIATPRGIAIMPVTGGARELIPDSKEGFMPLWSPDGKHILFARSVHGKTDLHLFGAQNRRTRRIGPRWNWPYVWRENSKRFAAVQMHDSGEEEIVWYDLAEGGVAQAVPVPHGPTMIVWLPDSDDLAFLTDFSKKADVYLVEGGEVKRVTNTSDVISLALSPDRKALLWVRKGANLKHQLLSIYRYDLAKRSVARLTFPMRIPIINPDSRRAPKSIEYATFAPAGDRIAIVTKHTEKSATGSMDRSRCYVMRLDGSEARLVRSAEGLLPVWSRDGSRLGVVDLGDKKLVVAVFDASGTNGRRILTESTK